MFLLFGLLCTVTQSAIADSRRFVLQKSYISQYSLDFTCILLEVPGDFRIYRRFQTQTFPIRPFFFGFRIPHFLNSQNPHLFCRQNPHFFCRKKSPVFVNPYKMFIFSEYSYGIIKIDRAEAALEKMRFAFVFCEYFVRIYEN